MNKVLTIDEKMERALTSVCDAALKFQGLQIMNTVVEVAQAIRENEQKPAVQPVLDDI